MWNPEDKKPITNRSTSHKPVSRSSVSLKRGLQLQSKQIRPETSGLKSNREIEEYLDITNQAIITEEREKGFIK